MTKNEVLQIIINKLDGNYLESDYQVLVDILEEKIRNAKIISNRDFDENILSKDLEILSPEIIGATIISYQQRGTEYSKNKSELGESSTFVDVDEYLRNNIIKNGKRVIF